MQGGRTAVAPPEGTGTGSPAGGGLPGKERAREPLDGAEGNAPGGVGEGYAPGGAGTGYTLRGARDAWAPMAWGNSGKKLMGEWTPGMRLGPG